MGRRTANVQVAFGNHFFRDRDGVWSTSKHEDSTITYEIDFDHRSDAFGGTAPGGSDSISTSTWTGDGVTISANTTDTTNGKVTVTVTGTGGEAKNTITTANSDVIITKLRFYDGEDIL